MYGLIAKECHADRTNDKSKIAIFIRAAKAYKARALHQLEELLQELRYGAIRRKQELEQQLDQERSQLFRVSEAYEHLLNDPSCNLLVMFNQESMSLGNNGSHQDTLAIFRQQILPQREGALRQQHYAMSPKPMTFRIFGSAFSSTTSTFSTGTSSFYI